VRGAFNGNPLAVIHTRQMPLTRRELISGLATAAAASAITDLSFAQDAPSVRINAVRL
jgi:hypothetical protein